MSQPAPSLEVLFDVETAVEEAWRAVLEKYAIRAFTQRSAEELPAERVDVQCTLGAESDHIGFDSKGKPYAAAWFYTMSVEAFTRRSGGDPRRHGFLRARIRLAAQYTTDAFSEAVLPFHVLTARKGAGSTPGLATEDDCDVSTLLFSGTVSIRSTAWPK